MTDQQLGRHEIREIAGTNVDICRALDAWRSAGLTIVSVMLTVSDYDGLRSSYRVILRHPDGAM